MDTHTRQHYWQDGRILLWIVATALVAEGDATGNAQRVPLAEEAAADETSVRRQGFRDS
jgi:hypothetical protein